VGVILSRVAESKDLYRYIGRLRVGALHRSVCENTPEGNRHFNL
jgi:hypothetical protein